jgi:hypothetical protein
MVRERFPVDLAVLCTIVERLFGLAIMTARHGSGLHGVLLPQSWILELWEDFVTFKDRRLAPLWVLAKTTERLLEDIYTGEYIRHTVEPPGTFGESGTLHHHRGLTLYRATGLQEQGVQLVQPTPVEIPSRPVYCSHVSIFHF